MAVWEVGAPCCSVPRDGGNEGPGGNLGCWEREQPAVPSFGLLPQLGHGFAASLHVPVPSKHRADALIHLQHTPQPGCVCPDALAAPGEFSQPRGSPRTPLFAARLNQPPLFSNPMHLHSALQLCREPGHSAP